jgi:hypothetical protein
MERALSPLINQLFRLYREGRIPRELYQDTASLLKPLGDHHLPP